MRLDAVRGRQLNSSVIRIATLHVMNTTEALQILRALADGVDPHIRRSISY